MLVYYASLFLPNIFHWKKTPKTMGEYERLTQHLITLRDKDELVLYEYAQHLLKPPCKAYRD